MVIKKTSIRGELEQAVQQVNEQRISVEDQQERERLRAEELERESEHLKQELQAVSMRLEQQRGFFIGGKFDQYQRIARLQFIKDQPIGNAAQLLMMPVNQPEESSIRSIAHLKGDLLGQFFQQLTESAKRLREPDRFVLAYALLALTEAKNIELMVNYQFDEKHKRRYDRYNTHFYSRGAAPFIDAGQFNLDDLISAD